MPHIPKKFLQPLPMSFAPTSGTRPELGEDLAPAPRPAIRPQKKKRKKGARLGIPMLNMFERDVDPDMIYEDLTGKPYQENATTGISNVGREGFGG